MGFLDMFKTPDIDSGVDECRGTRNAVLLDVRTAEEYRQGHIPESVNVPLDEIGRADGQIPDKETPVFTYCLSGARSARAAAELRRRGYSRVKNIGGISSYSGKIVR
ncbi:MAG: rhodanese-like domain-containing protein [Oscillospiraceae bacterium]|nr:rhodanese-like domain-containing protein [Oscillospiraceae bacterium]